MRKTGQLLARLERAEQSMPRIMGRTEADRVAHELRTLGYVARPWMTIDGEAAVTLFVPYGEPAQLSALREAKLREFEIGEFAHVLILEITTNRPPPISVVRHPEVALSKSQLPASIDATTAERRNS